MPPGDDRHHVGDLGNITADAQGSATVDLEIAHLQLNGRHSVMGKALIVHAEADDLKSQPSGDACDGVACGVIGPADEEDQAI